MFTRLVVIGWVISFFGARSFDVRIVNASETDPLNATYIIEGQKIRLIDGHSEAEIVPGSATKVITSVFGKPAYGNIDGQGNVDAALILTYDPGGSGTFYYVAAARNLDGVYHGTNAILLGDRVAPQNIEVRNGMIVVNYAERRTSEPLSAAPTVGRSKYLVLERNELKERSFHTKGEVVLDAGIAAQSISLVQKEKERTRFSLELEGGPVWQSKNDVRIPGNSGTEFSFSDLTGNGPYAYGRITFDWSFREKHGFRIVVAPLRSEGNGSFDKPVSFAGSVFNVNVPTNGKYKFDTYRFSYRYLFLANNSWHLQIGGTILVRDAEIELEQAGVKASDSIVGVAPLLSFSLEWAFAKRWTAILDFEGLAGGPGRALDLAAKLRYDLTDRWSVGGGYRTLEGGVDSDDVYNFSWFNYAFLTVGYRF